MKSLIKPFIIGLLIGAIGLVSYNQAAPDQLAVGGGMGTINQLSQWIFDGTNITQNVADTPIKFTGLESDGDCITTDTSGVLDTSTCGGGGADLTSIDTESEFETFLTDVTNVFTNNDNIPVSNLNSGTGATSLTYWRGDGTWATPAGGGGSDTNWATSTLTDGSVGIYPTTPTLDVLFGSNATATAGFWFDQSASTTRLGNGGAGDSIIELAIDTVTKWVFGADDSTTNDDFVISRGSELGTTTALAIDGSTGFITTGTWNGTAIDISDYTNLAVTSPVVLTGDTLSINQSLLSITESQISDFGTYLTTITGSEGAFTGWDKDASDDFSPSTLLADYSFTDNSSNWNTAFGWGDHSIVGYLTGITGESLESLSDVGSFTQSTGDLLTWNGSQWVNTATSSLGITGGTGDLWSDPVDSDIIPGTSSAYDLGSPSAVFSKAYINTYYFPDEFAFRETASNDVLLFGSNQGNAVNYFQIENSATGNPLEFEAVGTDTNIGINLNTKGTADLLVDDEIVRTDEKLYSFTLASTSLEFISGGIVPVPREKDGYSISEIHCYVDGGTSIVVNVSDGTNDTESVTCTTAGASDTDITTNDTFTAGELAEVQIGTITGTPDYLSVSVFGTWN